MNMVVVGGTGRGGEDGQDEAHQKQEESIWLPGHGAVPPNLAIVIVSAPDVNAHREGPR